MYMRTGIAVVVTIIFDVAWVIWRYFTPYSEATKPLHFYVMITWVGTLVSIALKVRRVALG